MSVLELQHISKSYQTSKGELKVIHDFSVDIDKGDFVAIQGSSGSGKTTVLLLAGGLLEPDSGKVIVSTRDLYRLKREERSTVRASEIGFVFQQFHLLPYLNALDNIMLPSVAHSVKDSARRAHELIGNLGLTNRIHHYPPELSTGERQRVALARALLNNPSLILADEPTGNLDSENAQIVMEYLQNFAAEGGAVLLVTHDSRASHYAKRQLQLKDGRATEM